MISIEEFRVAAEAERRRHRRRLLALLGTMLLGVATIATLILVFHAEIRDVDPSDQQFAKVLVFLAMHLVILPPCVLALWLIRRRPTRDRRLSCPHCERNLAGASGLVLISGNCAHCGKPVFDPPPPQPPVCPNPIPVAEFAAAVRAHHVRIGWIMFSMIGGVFAYMGLFALVGALLGFAEEPIASRVSDSVATLIMVLFFAPMFGILVVGIGGMALLDRRSVRNPRLCCPACGKRLLEGAVDPADVISSRRCRHCHAIILTGPAAERDGAKLNSVAQFEAGCRRFLRGMLLLVAGVAVLGVILVGVLGVLEDRYQWTLVPCH